MATATPERCLNPSDLSPRRHWLIGRASAFMLGKSDTTGRDSYMFFGIDGELLSIKWEIYKTIFRYNAMKGALLEIRRIAFRTPISMEKPYIKPQFPLMYDLSSDPHEDNNLFYTDLTTGWVLAPNFRLIAGYQRSLKEYPNIKVGEDFKGYQK
jgi:hypothetical protein